MIYELWINDKYQEDIEANTMYAAIELAEQFYPNLTDDDLLEIKEKWAYEF